MLYFYFNNLKNAFLKRSTLPKYNEDSNPGTAETEGLVGPRLYHFLTPPPPLFALKRKIIKTKKKT